VREYIIMATLGDNFTYYETNICHRVPLKTKANRLSEKLLSNGQAPGKYKGRDVTIHQMIDMPVDDMLKSIKENEDIIPFNDPLRP